MVRAMIAKADSPIIKQTIKQTVLAAPVRDNHGFPPSLLVLWAVLLAVLAIPTVQLWLSLMKGSQPIAYAAVAFSLCGSAVLARQADTSAAVNVIASWERVWAAPFVFAACLVHAAAALLCLAKLTFLSYVAILAAMLFVLRGSQALKRWAPLFVMSIFLLPSLSDTTKAWISLPLQLISTATAAILSKLFIPLAFTGHYLFVNGHTLDVAPGCSGLSMWVSIFFCFAIWQLFERFRLSGYLGACAIVPVLTIAANSIRLALTAIIAYHCSLETAIYWHARLELVLLPLSIGILYLSLRRFRVAG